MGAPQKRIAWIRKLNSCQGIKGLDTKNLTVWIVSENPELIILKLLTNKLIILTGQNLQPLLILYIVAAPFGFLSYTNKNYWPPIIQRNLAVFIGSIRELSISGPYKE